jgi:hypothetical protein
MKISMEATPVNPKEKETGVPIRIATSRMNSITISCSITVTTSHYSEILFTAPNEVDDDTKRRGQHTDGTKNNGRVEIGNGDL